ncbi:hypothetical protein [Paracoccus rhizosphaerae]|uniref:Squalene/phytoene synthase n=1 Tax=Paracoccus rhizosphaerae TaxID=1133347 RepID=A0ABV6CU34_9RHOB|nr:hypothetical protein [Paracoccus rhizosphaerae]
MDGSLNQLMRLLANRGTEWLRQKILELPADCPIDHPGIGLLARAGRIAAILTGLRGRISPLEVIVQRRLTPALVRAGAARVIAGDRAEAMVDLMLAGALVARSDPLWQLAIEELSDDDTLPLAFRLALSDDPDLMHQVEASLTRPLLPCNGAHVIRITEQVMQLFQHGARRPRLGARTGRVIYDQFMDMAKHSRRTNCVQSQAGLAVCLCLLDPDHDLSGMLPDMIQLQRPDGSFPPRLGFSDRDQGFADAALPTLAVVLALHMAVYRRWRGARPVWLSSRPLQQALKEAARAVSRLAGPAAPADAAILLTCATGENWLLRLSPPRPSSAEIPHLAALCFRDAIAARHLRQWLNGGAEMPAATPHGRWLQGRLVMLTKPPDALLALWQRAAIACDEDGFMTCVRLASYHHDIPQTASMRRMTRRLAANALVGCHTASLTDATAHLGRLVLLARLSPQPAITAMAA